MGLSGLRSEERRVGKECSSLLPLSVFCPSPVRASPYDVKYRTSEGDFWIPIFFFFRERKS